MSSSVGVFFVSFAPGPVLLIGTRSLGDVIFSVKTFRFEILLLYGLNLSNTFASAQRASRVAKETGESLFRAGDRDGK